MKKIVEKEANKCQRGFSRMATMVRRTEDIIAEERASLENQKRVYEVKKEQEDKRRAEIEAKMELRRKQALLDPATQAADQ